MSQETRLAFEHPLERSLATGVEGVLDRISLRDYITSVEIGAFQLERDTEQRLSFNVVVEVGAVEGALEDDVDLILSYDRVTEAIDTELAAERLDLLETLAERIAQRILREPQAMRVFLRIEKLDRGAGKLGVEIMRAKGDGAEAAVQDDAPRPRVVFLGMAAAAKDHVSGWIDQLAEDAVPLVFCVPRAGGAMDVTDATAQRRIDLLAIEQQAWALAASDPRLAVVATRTELDWAMKNGQICVWAPSKIVLGSPDCTVDVARDDAELAAWFAAEIGACELVVSGADAPVGAALPIRSYSVAERDL